MLGVMLLAWACYPTAAVTYSHPQNTTNQWLIELRPGDSKLQLTMNYRRAGDTGFNYHNHDFGIELNQLAGLTRDQVMSAMGTNVHFQLKRDAGTFDFEGWFKQGNGSGHFTFAPSNSFNSELGRLGFGRATDEQLLSLAMADGICPMAETRLQGELWAQ